MKHRTVVQALVAIALLILARDVLANGIAVTNVALWNMNPAQKSVYVNFDVSWRNSWRGSDNWDAAWVFVKFLAPGSSVWQHATLDTANANHQAAAGSVVSAAPDGKGAFIYSAGPQTGSVNYAQVRLRWTYGADGYTFAKGDAVQVSVQAIEMVYIPGIPFYLGSGGAESGHFYQYTDGSQSTNPYPVSSEGSIAVGTTNGNLYYGTGSGYSGDRLGPIPAAFPKGYAPFYCMKYKVSQGQYADFLNKLTFTQATNNYPRNAAGNNRWSITGSYPNYTAAAPDRACNHLLWPYGTAYATWAALRPMTELEFEKACRGPALPVVGEYAWGSTAITQLTGFTGTDGSGIETPSPASANCQYSNGGALGGPVRVGIFATASSSRAAAGAGYYGVMELSGCLLEQCVSAGHSTGRSFQGTHGSGILNASGNATNADWPSYNWGASQALGAGGRGGDCDEGTNWLRAADRDYANDSATETPGGSYRRYGWRSVRTAP